MLILEPMSLEVKILASPDSRLSLWKDFCKDPRQNIWVVSDLRSKDELQTRFLAQRGFLIQSRITRARELWLSLLKEVSPATQVLSPEMARALALQIGTHFDPPFNSTMWSAVEQILDLLAPVLMSPQHSVDEWMQGDVGRSLRWGIWWNLAKKISQEFLRRNLLLSSWVPAFLLERADLSRAGKKPDWILDLGAQFSVTEAELVSKLSHNQNICVLQPGLSRQSSHLHLLKAYEFLRASRTQELLPDSAQSGRGVVEKWRCANSLNESEAAVQQVRNWIEQGVSPEHIAILAPRIEEFWPALQVLLSAEGIPYAKSEVTRLLQIPEILKASRQIQLWNDSLEYADFELTAKTRDFARFQSRFRRAQTRQDFAVPELDPTPLSCEEFVEKLEPIARASQADLFFDAIEKFVMSWTGPESITLSLSQWSEAFLRWLDRQETTLKPGMAGGIQVVNLLEGDLLSATHKVFLGLSDASLKSQTPSLLTADDANQFAGSQGFFLPHPEESALAFELQWQMQSRNLTACLSFSEVNSSEEPQAPSAIWLSHTARLRHPKSTLVFHSRLKTPDPKIQKPTWRTPESFSLSPTSVQRYLDCPYQFYVEKILRLESPSDRDWVLDARLSGSVLHAALEHILESEEPWDPTRIHQLFQKIRSQQVLDIMDENAWNLWTRKWSERLFAFAQEGTRSVWALEHPFEVQWKNWTFKGKVDRIDVLPTGELGLVDYKIRSREKFHFKNWLKENEIQLGLYWLLLEKSRHFEKIGSAVYWGLDDFVRSGIDQDVPPEDRVEFFRKLEDLLEQTLHRLEQKDFAPNPRKDELCVNCSWRSLCREPRMN